MDHRKEAIFAVLFWSIVGIVPTVLAIVCHVWALLLIDVASIINIYGAIDAYKNNYEIHYS